MRDIGAQALMTQMDAIGDQLLQARQSREKPLRDEKIISAWNGMMISAFAEAGDALNKPEYVDAAVRAANFIWDNNGPQDGELLRAFYDGSASVESAQEDYAYLAESFLMLYDVTGKSGWLTRAEALTNTMHEKFWDVDVGGYFLGTEKVGAVRPKDIYDSSIPTGNAVAMRVLTRLWHRTGKELHKLRADALLVSFSGYLEQYPSAFSYMLTGASELLLGEAAPRQYVARGNVKVHAHAVGDELHIELDMAPGWHVNANKPNQDYLIATQLNRPDGNEIADTRYPEVVTKKLGFQSGDEALALYENKVLITAPLSALMQADDVLMSVSLQLQACDDSVCLAPEDVQLSATVAN